MTHGNVSLETSVTVFSAINPLSFPLRLCASARVLVFIDGQEFIKDGYTTSHIYAVEAHEIAHYILKHDMSAPSKEQEMAADVAAIQILHFLDHQVAKNLLITRFTSLYTGDYSMENNLSPKEQELLKSYLKLRKYSWWENIKKFLWKFKK